MGGMHFRNMTPVDRDEVARLIFHSTNRYYTSIGREAIFKGDELSAAVFFDVYERIDPGQGLLAIDDDTGMIVGSCFVHPRTTHYSLGIMNSHPDHFGRGVARRLLQRVIELAEAEGKPVRLVSSCFNLDSYSLYTRAGFVPVLTFQDMYVEVPEDGLPCPPPAGIDTRDATIEDAAAMEALERELVGISRLEDYRYFLNNDDGLWSATVIESRAGLDGYLISCGAEMFNMLGPGVARTQDQAAALIHTELNRYPGRMPVFLVPVSCGDLVQVLYAYGARNCEMHVAQVHGPAQLPRGVVMPTFLPETG